MGQPVWLIDPQLRLVQWSDSQTISAKINQPMSSVSKKHLEENQGVRRDTLEIITITPWWPDSELQSNTFPHSRTFTAL